MTSVLAGRRAAAAGFGAVYLICLLVQPAPDGPDPTMHWWHATVDISSVFLITAAVVTLARGRRSGPGWGVAAGAGMVVETVLCPGSGHHHLGWWVWAQAALSLAVLTASVLMTASHIRRPASARPAPKSAVITRVSRSAESDDDAVVRPANSAGGQAPPARLEPVVATDGHLIGAGTRR